MRRTRSFVLALLAGLVLALTAAGCGGASDKPNEGASAALARVGIAQFNDIPAFAAVIASFKEAMTAAGYREGETVTYELRSAHGDTAAAAGVATTFSTDPFDLVLAVGTPAAQALVATDTVIPIVFVAVTDPVGAQLVENVAAPEGGMTGVANLLPVAKPLALVRQIVPPARRVGLLYNPAEAQSVILAANARKAAPGLGLKVVTATIDASAAAGEAAEALAARTDAVLVLTDSTALAAIDDVAAACRAAGVPLITGDLTAVAAGAVAGYGFDLQALGQAAAEMSVALLGGTPVAQIPVHYSEELLLAVNAEAAAATGLTLPSELTAAADQVY